MAFRAASGGLSGSPPGRPAALRGRPTSLYPRAPGRPNYQHRNEFWVFSPEDIGAHVKYPHDRSQDGQQRPRLAAKVTPSPSPVSGRTKGLFGTPQQKSPLAKWLGTPNLKFGVRPSTPTAETASRALKRQQKRINAAPPSSTARVVPYPARAVKALGRRYALAGPAKKPRTRGSPPRRLRVVGGYTPPMVP